METGRKLFLIEREVGGNGFDGPRRIVPRTAYLPADTVLGSRIPKGFAKGFYVIRLAIGEPEAGKS